MLNKFKKIILFSVFLGLIIGPATSFAWHDYNDGWDYHGSGRDYPYSYVVDNYYRPRYVYYFKPGADFVDEPIPQKIKITAMPPVPSNDLIVNIPNRYGGFTAVVIKRSGYGFVGPQGEYYPEFPKIFQLEIKYGK